MKLLLIFYLEYLLFVTSEIAPRSDVLLGRKDGHDELKDSLIGQTIKPFKKLIGEDDGHENNEPLLGLNEGHDGQKGPLIGTPDGHDGQLDNIGKDDGHEIEAPLLGRKDGHDGKKEYLIGQPDGHDGQMIGGNDGHENRRPLLGRNDGHEGQKGPLIGQPDGHDGEKTGSIGKKDGHENRKPLLGRNDGHDGQKETMIGKDDGHEKHGSIIGKNDGHDLLQPDSQLFSNDRDSLENDDQDLFGQDEFYTFSEESYDNPDEVETDDDSMERDDDDDDDEPLVRCKRPMCKVYCQFGFQTGTDGCPICKCIADPCEDLKCDIGMKCEVMECSDVFECTKLPAKCIPKRCDGPEPMCANYCQFGYQLNDRGCMTCFCRLPPISNPTHEEGPNCGTGVCKVGQICKWKQGLTNQPEHPPQCKAKPVCFTAQEQSGLSRDINHGGAGLSVDPRIFVPKCSEDGSFEPRQCHNIRSECWCVDDKGGEVFGTRSVVISEDKMPKCKLNQSIAVKIDMVFNDNSFILDNRLSFERNLVDKLVSLLNLDEPNFNVEKIMEYKSQREDANNNIPQIRVLLMLLRVFGDDDFPSVVEYFKLVAKQDGIVVSTNGKLASLDPDSIRCDYIYEEGFEEMGHSQQSSTWFYCSKLRQHQVMITIILFLLMIIALVLAILLVRRRCGRHQIRHHQLQNKLTFAHNQGLYNRGPLKNESAVLITDDVLDKEKANMA